jgi:GNAT superfamily N-acetyltransferase
MADQQSTTNILDYLSAPCADVAALLEAHSSDLGLGEVSASEILSRIDSGNAELVRFPHGCALLQGSRGEPRHLWVLFVDPAWRGRGIGRGYVRELVQQHAGDYYLTLHCRAALRPFYGRLGFRVLEREGDFRKMQGPFRRGERPWGK